MTLSQHKRLFMTPLDILLGEIFLIDPSFTIVYNAESGKTCGICRPNAIFEAESLSRAIILAWLYYFSGKEAEKYVDRA